MTTHNLGSSAPRKPAEGRTFTLPSGKIGAYRMPVARDLEKAAIIVGPSAMTQMPALLLAVFALIGTIDGRQLTYEEVQDLPMFDGLGIMGELGSLAAGNESSPAQEISSNLLDTPAGDSTSSAS